MKDVILRTCSPEPEKPIRSQWLAVGVSSPRIRLHYVLLSAVLTTSSMVAPNAVLSKGEETANGIKDDAVEVTPNPQLLLFPSVLISKNLVPEKELLRKVAGGDIGCYRSYAYSDGDSHRWGFIMSSDLDLCSGVLLSNLAESTIVVVVSADIDRI